jgi:hypothetical protein
MPGIEPRLEAAYDLERANLSPRRAPFDRVVFVWRLYRVTPPPELGAPEAGPLSGVRSLIRSATREMRALTQWVSQRRQLVLEYRMPLLVQQYQVRRDARTSLRYAFRNAIIDHTPQALGVAQIRLAGLTYAEPVMVNGVPMDGNAALKTFQQLIEHVLAPGDGTLQDYELYLIDLNALASAEDPIGEAEWRVVPSSAVEVSVSAERPLLRGFRVDLWGLETNRDRMKADDGILGLLSTGLLADLLARIPGGQALLDTLRDVAGLITDAEQLFAETARFVATVQDVVNGVADAIRQAAGMARGLVTRIGEAIGRIEDAVKAIRGLASLPEQELKKLLRTFPLGGDVRAPRVLREAHEGLLRLRDLALGTITVARVQDTTVHTVTYVGPGADASASAVPTPGARRRIVPTLRPSLERALILAEIGVLSDSDARKKQELQERLKRLPLNDDPDAVYLGEAVQAQLTPGPQVRAVSIFPADAEIEATQARALGRPITLEDRLMGVDLRHDMVARDVVWDTSRTDLALLGGLASMLAMLERYMILPLGALRYAPGVGTYLGEVIGGWARPDNYGLALLAVHKTLAQDPRVRRVRRVELSTVGGSLRLTYDAELVDGREHRQMTVEVPG